MKGIYRRLYFWVLVAIVAGVVLGQVAPEVGQKLGPVSDGFIALIRMLIAPIVFCTVALGITQAGDMKKVGRVGLRTIVYFEAVSSLALFIGIAVGNILKPGAGFHADASKLNDAKVVGYAKTAESLHVSDYLLHIIPSTFFDAFTAGGNLLQVLLVAILSGYALNKMGSKGEALRNVLEQVSQMFFTMVNLVVKLAPLGAGAAMAFTVGTYGLASLKPLAALMGCFYLTCILFIVAVLGAVAHLAGFNIFRFLRAVADEVLIVLGTSSSESALAPLMEKLETMGCPKDIVGLVVPSGYSFNLDGTNIYLTLATLFVAQALGVDLSFSQQMTIFAVAMLTSKGASGVTGAGFITLAATLAVVPDVPVKGLALILGIDRFMSEARAMTNLIGNGVACVVVSRWEKSLDARALQKALDHREDG